MKKLLSSLVIFALVVSFSTSGISEEARLPVLPGMEVNLEPALVEGEIAIIEGWNLIAMPVLPVEPYTVKRLINDIERPISPSDWRVLAVAVYKDGQFKKLPPEGYSYNMVPGEAYFVYAQCLRGDILKVWPPPPKKTVVTIKGWALDVPVSLNLSRGWNGVSIAPTVYIDGNPSWGLKRLSEELIAQKVKAKSIALWLAEEQQWEIFNFDPLGGPIPGNRTFPPDTGLFILCEENGLFIPGLPPLRIDYFEPSGPPSEYYVQLAGLSFQFWNEGPTSGEKTSVSLYYDFFNEYGPLVPDAGDYILTLSTRSANKNVRYDVFANNTIVVTEIENSTSTVYTSQDVEFGHLMDIMVGVAEAAFLVAEERAADVEFLNLYWFADRPAILREVSRVQAVKDYLITIRDNHRKRKENKDKKIKGTTTYYYRFKPTHAPKGYPESSYVFLTYDTDAQGNIRNLYIDHYDISSTGQGIVKEHNKTSITQLSDDNYAMRVTRGHRILIDPNGNLVDFDPNRYSEWTKEVVLKAGQRHFTDVFNGYVGESLVYAFVHASDDFTPANQVKAFYQYLETLMFRPLLSSKYGTD